MLVTCERVEWEVGYVVSWVGIWGMPRVLVVVCRQGSEMVVHCVHVGAGMRCGFRIRLCDGVRMRWCWR